MVERVLATEEASALIESLRGEHGALLFHQSGGCCDGSAPMCFALGEFMVGARDVYLGDIAGCPFYMSAEQFEYWRHSQLILDVFQARGGGFSLEVARGVRFLTRSRLFSDEEVVELEHQPLLQGPQA